MQVLKSPLTISFEKRKVLIIFAVLKTINT